MIVWPIWLGICFRILIFIENDLGYDSAYEGPEWLVYLVAFSIIGIGIYLWRFVIAFLSTRWGVKKENP